MRTLSVVFNALATVVLVVGFGVAAINATKMQDLRTQETNDANRSEMESATALAIYGTAAGLIGGPMMFLCGGIAGFLHRQR